MSDVILVTNQNMMTDRMMLIAVTVTTGHIALAGQIVTMETGQAVKLTGTEIGHMIEIEVGITTETETTHTVRTEVDTVIKTTEVKVILEVKATEVHKDNMVVTMVTGEITHRTEVGEVIIKTGITTGTIRIGAGITRTIGEGTEGVITRVYQMDI